MHEDLIARLTAMYEGDALLRPLWESAVKTQELTSDIGGNNGRNGAELGKLAASLMLPADGARVMMVETGGWDTHSAQRGRLAVQLRGLDQLVGALRTGLGPVWADTLVIVATEFGRTIEVNGTGGTDHGTASTAMFFGGGLADGPYAWALGLLGLGITMVGIMLPSTTLAWFATRWLHHNAQRRGVRAFKQGMAPVVVGLLVATGLILANGNQRPDTPAWHLWLVAGVAGLVVWRTRIHLLWLLGAGASLGALGFV